MTLKFTKFKPLPPRPPCNRCNGTGILYISKYPDHEREAPPGKVLVYSHSYQCPDCASTMERLFGGGVIRGFWLRGVSEVSEAKRRPRGA